MTDRSGADDRRRLPSVEAVVADVSRRVPAIDRALLVRVTRAQLARQRAADGDPEPVAEAVARVATELVAGDLRRVINATGIVLQTNLGRAPLSESAVAKVGQVARGYSNLEYDIDSGSRGERGGGVSAAIEALTGAPALVVNNNAAAILLMLATLAKGREVIVSRGELIEIGGSFRLPDVMRLSGARLVEVGTTNRTRLADYRDAIGERTAAVMKVQASNYTVVGFTESVSSSELAALARGNGILAIEDLGSGNLSSAGGSRTAKEPTVSGTIAAGMHLCAFSGDKLLGGPQAGIIAGDIALLQRLRRNPLYRALRPDKLAVAALEGTLSAYVRGSAGTELPVRRMLEMTAIQTEQRAREWAAALATAGPAEVVEVHSATGGGALPGEVFEGFGLALGGGGQRPSARVIAERLRARPLPIIGRVEHGRVLLDPRTVNPEDDEELVAGVRAALAP